jgi:hypothetical protein
MMPWQQSISTEGRLLTRSVVSTCRGTQALNALPLSFVTKIAGLAVGAPQSRMTGIEVARTPREEGVIVRWSAVALRLVMSWAMEE